MGRGEKWGLCVPIDVNTNTQTQGEDAVLDTAHVYGTEFEIIIRSGYY